jgi:hypothetical protein
MSDSCLIHTNTVTITHMQYYRSKMLCIVVVEYSIMCTSEYLSYTVVQLGTA